MIQRNDMEKKCQYPNGLLEEIRSNARVADPNFKLKLSAKLAQQKKLPKLPNTFKTASSQDLESYFKKETL